MSKPKVFIVQPYTTSLYNKMFHKMGWEVACSVAESDLVQFTGGVDVNPDLYKHDKHPTTHFQTSRDVYDAQYFELAKRLGKPMAGICRGGQFLNVVNGGTLIQHTDGHALGHNHLLLDINTGATVEVSSTHHQMMMPSEHAVVVATANESSMKLIMKKGCAEEDVQHKMSDDIEVLYYDEYNCLCFQPHPEFNDVPHCREYYFACLRNYLGLTSTAKLH